MEKKSIVLIKILCFAVNYLPLVLEIRHKKKQKSIGVQGQNI